MRPAVSACESVVAHRLVSIDDLAVTSGAADALRLVFSYLVRTGRRSVLVCGPRYAIVHQTMLAAGLVFREILGDASRAFMPSVEHVEAALATSKADRVFLTQPNNPTGHCYAPAELGEVFSTDEMSGACVVLEKNGSDVLGSRWPMPYGRLAAEADLTDLFVIDSLSKRRGVCGLRLGYIVGGSEIVEHVAENRFGDCPPLIGQRGAAADLVLSAAIAGNPAGSFTSIDACGLGELVADSDAVEIHRRALTSMYHVVAENRRVARDRLGLKERKSFRLDAGANHVVAVARREVDDVAFSLEPLPVLPALLHIRWSAS